MEKAYELKDLGMKLKSAGLPILEEALEASALEVYKAVKAWAKESAAMSENKIDDVVAAFYDQLDVMVLPLIDKIDGKEG